MLTFMRPGFRETVYAVAAAFPRWSGVAVRKEAARIIPAWSRFYLGCRICHEPVLDDKAAMLAHWDHHILMGDVVAPKEE